MKFKIGQKVKVIGCTYTLSESARKMVGNIDKILCVDDIDNTYQLGCGCWFNELDLEAVSEEKTWETLQVNDVLIDRNGNERGVLGVCGRVIFLSYSINKDDFHISQIKEHLRSVGWKIKQNTPTEEVEMTVEEATKKLGELLNKTVNIVYVTGRQE